MGYIYLFTKRGCTKILPVGVIYEFRYFIDGKNWANDEDAIEVHNSFGGTNSAIDLSA